MILNDISYTDQGKGPVLVLIHGFCESGELWEDFGKELSKDFRVLVPDLPGFGKSDLMDSNISMEYFADKICQWLILLDVEKCTMIGHSLGGYITLAFAEKYESMLSAIGMFHSTAFEDSPKRKDSRNKTIDFIEKHGVALFAQSFVTPLFYYPNRKNLHKEIDKVIRIASESSFAGVIETTKAMRDRKERIEVLKSISVPVLFIIGKEDTTIPLEKSLEQAALPAHHVIHVLPDTAHMGMVEKKEETIKMVRDFVLSI